MADDLSAHDRQVLAEFEAMVRDDLAAENIPPHIVEQAITQLVRPRALAALKAGGSLGEVTLH